MSLQFQLSEGGVSDLKEFVSLKLPLRQEVSCSGLSGLFSDVRGAYQGVFQTIARAFLEDGR